MTEYFLLAIAVSFPLYVYGLHGILLMLLAGGICIAFACGDEYHQSFVAGRSPSMKDVGIDSVGVFIGIIIVRIIGWTGRMTIFRPIKKKDGAQKLSQKQQQETEQMQRNMYNQGYAPYQNGYSQAPYPNQQYSDQGGYAPGYQGQSAPYSGMPYPDQNTAYQQTPYPSADAPYPGQNYSSQNGPYPNEDYSSAPYQDGSYPGQGSAPYQDQANAPYGSDPYQGNRYPGNYQHPQAPQYMGRQDESSDELSEDMPLSHLLKPKKRK